MSELFLDTLLTTMRDVSPILLLLIGFQIGVLKQTIHHHWQVMRGFIYVMIGLTLFLMGLEQAIFPLGKLMAQQLTAAATDLSGHLNWQKMGWVYLFAFTIGIATTLAEPALMAVAMKAEQISAGSISALGLRITVALGAATGITLGCLRIATGTELWIYISIAYSMVMLLTIWTPKSIIPLAYDLGGVTTSMVTVPLLAALGLGLAEAIPGRNPLMDGFGIIAFAALFPIISVQIYAILGRRLQ